MNKATESKLNCFNDEWVANGSKPQEMTSDFADTLLCACREEVNRRYNRLDEISCENIAETVSCKIKARLYENKSKPIENIAAFVRRACHNEAVSEVQGNLIPKVDDAGRVEINPETGKTVKVSRMTSGDAPTPTNDGDEGTSLFERKPSTIPTPADELEREDALRLLRKIDKELDNLLRQKAEVFRLVVFARMSALDVARRVYHSKAKAADAPSTKKLWQDKIACVVWRARKHILKKFKAEAEEIGILRRQQAHAW